MRRSPCLWVLLALVFSATPARAQTTSFVPGGSYSSSSDTPGVALADLNKDGKLDLIVATCENSTVRVRLGNGDGTFGAATDYATLASAFGIAIADFNRDGNLDVATADEDDSSIAVFLGDGTGALGPPVQFP